MDWKNEVENLKEISDMENLQWFEASAGTHKIKILKEGNEFTSTFKDGTIVHKVRLEIQVNDERMNWGVTKGLTQNSLYGQLCLLGAEKGTLEGQSITLLIKGTGKNKDYTVVEAMPLQKAVVKKIRVVAK